MLVIPDNTDFVKIVTLFDESHPRNVLSLAKLYTEADKLKDLIRKITKGIIDNDQLINGKNILIKPNWVRHSIKESDRICLVTNETIIIILVELILEKRPAKIIIGDAPVQGCLWDKLINLEFINIIQQLSIQHSTQICINDFRRVTFNPIKNNPIKEIRPLSDYLIFDLEKNSCLEPVSSSKNNFRVTNYDPDRLADSHAIGKHKYCLTNELFYADVVISIPKIKTHQKTGITGALKNLVGLNGDKDFLPHHRVGGTEWGGDCYPGKNILRRLSEFALDNANRNQGKNKYWLWTVFSKVFWKSSFPGILHTLEAGWYGNDTCWRMVMDLNRIAEYGKPDGTMSKQPMRKIYSLCDGIIGGQGNGPLDPIPLPLGIMCFTNNSYITDICMAVLMGFDPQKIPLLRTASEYISEKEIELTLNGSIISRADLEPFSIQTLPPPGWNELFNPDQFIRT